MHDAEEQSRPRAGEGRRELNTHPGVVSTDLDKKALALSLTISSKAYVKKGNQILV